METFHACSVSKLTKKAKRAQYFCVRTFNMGVKKAEFDADFESVEKVAIISCKK